MNPLDDLTPSLKQDVMRAFKLEKPEDYYSLQETQRRVVLTLGNLQRLQKEDNHRILKLKDTIVRLVEKSFEDKEES